MPATLAILSIVFVESIFSAAGVTDQASRVEHKVLAVVVLAITNGVNGVSTKFSTRLNNLFIVTKFASIAAIAIAALVVVILQASDPKRKDVGGRDWYARSWFEYRDTVEADGSKTHWRKLSEWELFGHLSAAIYGALWAYSGWDKVSFECDLAMKSLAHPYRQSTFRQSFQHRGGSFRLPSIWPYQSSSFALSLSMRPITFCFHGISSPQQIAWQ